MTDKTQAKNEGEKRRALHIIGLLDPWSPSVAGVIDVTLAAERLSRTSGWEVQPDASGLFSVQIDRTSEIEDALRSGRLTLEAKTKEGKLLGAARLWTDTKVRVLGVRIRCQLPRHLIEAAEARPRPGAFVPNRAVRRLALGLARLQGVPVREARAPNAVLKAIAELNRVDAVASRALSGDKASQKELTDTLAAAAHGHPGGAGPGLIGATGGRGGGSGTFDSELGDLISGATFGGNCGPSLLRGARIMDSAFRLDMRSGSSDVRWTRQARAYVQSRMRTVSEFAGSVDRAVRNTSDGAWGIPTEEGYGQIPGGGPGDPFPPDGESQPYPEPPMEPDPPSVPGSDLCDQVRDLCLALYQELLSAQARDELTDRIATVEPNCLCSAYDPTQIFIARPQPGLTFPVRSTAAGLALPADVLLHFRSTVLTPVQVQSNEIRFQIPANEHTGFVYLRQLGSLPSHASRQLSRACGLVMPELPNEILLDRAPAALISVVYPPVVEVFGSGAAGQPVEACTPIEISWRVRLIDQAANLPLPPCASIEVTVRDSDGNVVAAGGKAGSVVETRSNDVTYSLEARSLAGGVICGAAVPATLTVQRVHLLRLAQDPATGVQVLGGNPGRFVVSISCPAPVGGTTVNLATSDAAALQVPAQIVIQEGAQQTGVDFTTAAACVSVDLTAVAADHTLVAPLRIEVYEPPALQWVGPVPNPIEQTRFSAEVDAACVPDDPGRANWVLLPVNPGPLPVPVAPVRTSGQYPASRYRVPAPGLAAGDWQLIVELPDRNSIRSNALGFTVALRPTFEITSITPMERTIEWGNQANYDVAIVGQNLVGNVAIDLEATLASRAALSSVGLQPAFNPPIVQLTAAAPAQNTVLSITGPVAVAALGRANIRVRAQAPLPHVSLANAFVNVRRQTGPFTVKSVAFTREDCANGDVKAFPDATGTGPGVRFEVTRPSGTIHTSPQPVVPAVYFAISPHCRIGIVVPPMTGGAGDPALNFFNLGFEPTAGAPQIGHSVLNLTRVFWQRFWFSPDDSLMVLIGRAIRGGGGTATHTASLFDMIGGGDFKPTVFFTPAIIQSADDPSPLQPGDTAIELAVIDGIDLARDAMDRDVVTVTYRDPMYAAQSFSMVAA